MSTDGDASIVERYFARADGSYAGAFRLPDAVLIGMLPAGAVEVPMPPNDPRFDRWDGAQWVALTDRHFAHPDGRYIGFFRVHDPELATLLPAGAIEVPSAPADGILERWNGAQWVPDLAAVKRRRKEQVDLLLGAALEAGLAYGGKVLQIDPESQRNIIAKSQRAEWAAQGLASWNPAFAWRMADNSYLALPTPQEMMALAAAADEEVTRLKYVAFTHKDAIDALQSAAEVEAYNIDQGWA